jgi:eukaryotic-like serine/threonine-protein kinase
MVHREATDRVVGGRYALRRLLGRGGMGVVWEAEDGVLGRRVALKEVEIPPAVGAESDAVRARVLREARAAARLNHPCAVTTYDVARDEDRVFIIMELVELPTLTDVVAKEGPLAPERAAAIGAQVAEVLQSAHERGIVHRDVKPGNLMVGRGDRVKVADFGIASVKDDSRITATGLVLGSPSFMAPEQAQTSASGPAADTWGLGATLFYAVEGTPPFDRGSAIATLAAAGSEDPPAAERAGPLGPLIARMLNKDPESRPADADLVDALRAVAAENSGPRDLFDGVAPVTPHWDPPTDSVHRAAPSTPARGRGGLRWIFALVLLAAAIGGLWAARDGLRAGGDLVRNARRAIAESGGTDKSGSPSSGARPERGQDPGPGPGSGGSEGEVPVVAPPIPEEWQSYTDPDTGYELTYPVGWEVRTQSASDTTTDFFDPDTGTYLRVDWTDDPGPSPEAAWEQQSDTFAQTHDDYVEIRIDPTVYRGFDAAMWEYSYREGDASLHAYNLGFVTPEYGFALNFQTRSENWTESQPLFERFQKGFRVPSD